MIPIKILNLNKNDELVTILRKNIHDLYANDWDGWLNLARKAFNATEEGGFYAIKKHNKNDFTSLKLL